MEREKRRGGGGGGGNEDKPISRAFVAKAGDGVGPQPQRTISRGEKGPTKHPDMVMRCTTRATKIRKDPIG